MLYKYIKSLLDPSFWASQCKVFEVKNQRVTFFFLSFLGKILYQFSFFPKCFSNLSLSFSLSFILLVQNLICFDLDLICLRIFSDINIPFAKSMWQCVDLPLKSLIHEFPDPPVKSSLHPCILRCLQYTFTLLPNLLTTQRKPSSCPSSWHFHFLPVHSEFS